MDSQEVYRVLPQLLHGLVMLQNCWQCYYTPSHLHSVGWRNTACHRMKTFDWLIKILGKIQGQL